MQTHAEVIADPGQALWDLKTKLKKYLIVLNMFEKAFVI